jgi:hypothetical protein
MRATARRLSVVRSTSCARRRLIRDVRLTQYATRDAMKPEIRRSRDWATPLILFVPVMSIATIHGHHAEMLRLPTAWFAQSSHIWMLGLVILSFFISTPKLATAVWITGLGCVAYAPLLVSLGSSLIPLSRSLTSAESSDFRHRFPVPVLLYSASGEGDCLRVRRQDFTDAMRSHIQSIGALRQPTTSH